LSKRKTIRRRKSSTERIQDTLKEFIEDRIFGLVCDELDILTSDLRLSSVCYEPVWTRKADEKYIKQIRINLEGEGFKFRTLDICIVEAYSLEMEDIVEFFEYNCSKKVRFKKS
jgi:hypothetical protein